MQITWGTIMNTSKYLQNRNELIEVFFSTLASEISRVPLRAALVSVAITMLSGCVLAPERTATTSFVSTVSGYPDMATSKRKMARPEKVIKRTLPTKVASYSFLGRAPYICTPSGFGRTSGCFLRRG
jgi:hypothetical protein